MTRLTPLRASDFKRSPWKNGLGWTDQIAISPSGADLKRGDFDWRISTAKVAQSASFSPFPDHDRILVVIDGAGVTLSHAYAEGEPPEVVELPPGEPYEFPGDVPTRCELRGGPIQDFSVFLRKGVVSAMVESIEIEGSRPFEWDIQARTGFVFVVSGSIEAQGASCAAGDALRIERQPEDLEPVRIEARSARVLLVQIEN
jgi:environmental stress-induced protein Ves